ncbi:hypothetical protein QCA50_009016 [Cerrena zonata]|uniref:Smr domain-containing protein n=1 Tax=Cerrena zonata TaxID=2478898 RepID=A0AAW0G8C7_9APHY
MRDQTYSLEERLQAEFCPPLDSSLIAAFITDYCPEGQVKPSSQAEQSLRTILSELAAQAERDEECALSDRFDQLEFGTTCSVTDEASSGNDLFSNDTQVTSPTALSSNTSEASGSSGSTQPFSSPIGFLQTAFPDIPTHRLRSIVSSMGDIDDLDMEEVVDHICSLECVRELEQRGMDELSDDQEDLTPWLAVEKKKSFAPSKKQKQRGTTFTFGDVRQTRHIRPSTAPNSPNPNTNGASAPDPWTQASSLASHLATLVPSIPASRFHSIFHSPEYNSPSVAIRATLRSIKPLDESIEFAHALSIFEFLENGNDFTSLSPSEREQLMSDAKLAVRATGGQPDVALDLVQVLRDLDSDAVSGEVEWRLYHSPAPPQTAYSPRFASNAARRTKLKLKLPTEPPPVPPPPTRQHSSPISPVTSNAWKTIAASRVKSEPSSHPLKDFIPAYDPSNIPTKKGKARGGINGPGRKAVTPGNENRTHSLRAKELMQERAQALKEAGRAWQNGHGRNRGGEVAFYYAEKARQLQQRAFKEQLAVAQDKVDASRQNSKNGNTIDLHGTTVAEAILIVKEILAEECPSQSKPLKIITGRGIHSINGVGVLGPAIKANLLGEGWNVGRWDGGLVVRGKS